MMARDWRKRPRCATSGKIRFATRNQALSLAAQIGTPVDARLPVPHVRALAPHDARRAQAARPADYGRARFVDRGGHKICMWFFNEWREW